MEICEKFLLILLVFVPLTRGSTTDEKNVGEKSVFTSVESIKEALKMDELLADHFRQQLRQLDQYRASVLEYLSEQERMRDELGLVPTSESYESEAEKLRATMAANPLNAMQTIRRIAVDIPKLSQHLSSITKGFQNYIAKAVRGDATTFEIRYGADFQQTITGLLRLQNVYHLPARDLVRGQILNLQTSTRLSIADCLLLAEGSKTSKRLDLFVEWREQAHELCMQRGLQTDQLPHCTHTTGSLLTAAIQEHDETRRSHLNELKKNESYQLEYLVFPKSVEEVPASEQEKLDVDVLLRNPQSPMTLCYVERRIMEPAEEAKLFCNYLTRPSDPYVTLQRFKVEVQSAKPLIMTIHDVVSSNEANLIRQLSIPYLHRSGVISDSNPDKDVYSDFRISETAWIPDSHNPEIETISRRIQRITGLSTQGEDAELLQVVNYGIGGMFSPHFDFLHTAKDIQNKLNDTGFMGNRIMTFMIYLSDVQLGGSTTFPFAQVAVRPRKGSATVWYNLRDDGQPDYETLHGGCPVLYGSKWIANKWILERGQLFQHPCPQNMAK